MSFDLTNLTNLQALQDLASRIQTKFNALQAADVSLKGVSVVGNSLKFFTSTDTSTTPAFSIDLPAEMFLDSVSTGLVPNFAFSAATYEGATDPNLNGKPVLVLGIKTRNNDGVSETISYSFLDMSTLVDVYTASDTSIIITDYKVKVNVSADSDNMLATTANGLYVDGSGKIDKVVGTVGNVVTFAADGAVSDTGILSADVLTKVAGATENNLATYTADGGISDSGIAIATNAEVTEMLNSILGYALKTAISISSTSDFFSTNATSFHNFVQAALAADAENGNADDTAALSFIAMTDFPIMFDFTYGDLTTLQSNANATIQDVVTLLNSKLQEAAELEELEDFDVTASFSGTALTFSTNEDTLSWNITTGMGETGKYIMKSIYDNAADTSGFTDDGGGDYTFNKKIE